MKLNKFSERLVREWTTHGKLIIAVDFDDTVFPYSMDKPEDHARYERVFALLCRCQRIGAHVVMWSCSAPDRYPFIKEYVETESKGRVRVDAVNENKPGLPFGEHKKIYANVYLDERAGLEEAMYHLSSAATEMERLAAEEESKYVYIVNSNEGGHRRVYRTAPEAEVGVRELDTELSMSGSKCTASIERVRLSTTPTT